MMRTTRGARAAALLLGASLVAAACGSDNNSSEGGATTTGAATTAAATTAAPAATTAASTATTTGGSTGTGKMTVTYKINPKAVWADGSPVTSKDFECHKDAVINTPGSILSTGYTEIESTDASKPDTYVVTFKKPYAPWKGLFSPVLTQASKIANCKDVSKDFADAAGIPSATPFKLESFSPDQIVLVPNDKFWDAASLPKAKKVVIVPRQDDGGVAALKAGEVDMIFPQAAAGVADALKDPNIKVTPGYGVNYENWWLQVNKGPFADKTFRDAFLKSVDRDLIIKNIYDPLFPGAKAQTCAAWVPTIGKWCGKAFEKTYDPAAATKLLTDAGWKKNGEGLWADKSGVVPAIRWVTNGNKRRSDMQALMIPELKKAGFNVAADNGDSATVFQKRYPALDFELATYIFTASPDPTTTSILTCDQVPSEKNNNQGQNTSGYCNPEADKLMLAADAELDVPKREALVNQLNDLLYKDAITLPLYQFPNIVAFRTDKLSGPVDGDAANYMGPFMTAYKWVPSKGDTITIGAEQWPDCINPVTECGNSSWMVWMTQFPLYPQAFETTADGNFKVGALLAGEPTVTKP